MLQEKNTKQNLNPKKRQAAGSNNSASVLFTKRQICVNKCGFYLPFVITHSLILYLFFMYIFTYLRHLIGQTKFWSSVPSDGDKTRGIVLAVLLGWLVLWLEVSLHRAVFTHPGLVPPNSENADFDYDDNAQEEEEEEEEEEEGDPANRQKSPSESTVHFPPGGLEQEEKKSEQEDPNTFTRKTTDLRSVRNTIAGQVQEPAPLTTNTPRGGPVSLPIDDTNMIIQSEADIGPPPFDQPSGIMPASQVQQDIGQGQQLGADLSFPSDEDNEQNGLIQRRQVPQNLIRFRTIEKDKDGYNRFCKFCLHSKPDRSHHCKVCGTCVLKMDHHCPWILNCVGFHNYKFFLMLLFYAGLACLLIAASYWEAVVHAASNVTTGFAYLYSIFVAFFLAAVLAIVLLSFLTFHMLWLVIPNFTTIEFCEKRKDPSSVYSSYSPFSHGCKENFYATMGKNCLLWFFPFSRTIPNPLESEKRHEKDGMEFPFNERYRREYMQE